MNHFFLRVIHMIRVLIYVFLIFLLTSMDHLISELSAKYP